jgi:hypothetical protein
VSSPTTHRERCLFNPNSSLTLWSEGPCTSVCVFESTWGIPVVPVVSDCPVPDRFLATPIAMLQAGSGPINGRSDLSLANWSAISFPSTSPDLTPISIVIYHVRSVAREAGGSPRPVLLLMWNEWTVVNSGVRKSLRSSRLSGMKFVGEICYTLQQDNICYQTEPFDDVETGL